MILGLIMAAIFVYIGVNLEPGLVNSPFIQRWVKQTANIGGKLRCSRRGIALWGDARNDYQAVPHEGNGIVSSAMKNEIAVKNNVNTTVATITTPTYSSGVAGLNGVIMIVFAAMIIFGVKFCALIQRCMLRIPQNGEHLRWQRRANPMIEIGECVTTRRGTPLIEVMA